MSKSSQSGRGRSLGFVGVGGNPSKSSKLATSSAPVPPTPSGVPILTEDDLDILTEDDQQILTE